MGAAFSGSVQETNALFPAGKKRLRLKAGR